MIDVQSLKLLVYVIQSCVALNNYTVMESDNLDYFMDIEPEDPVCLKL